MDGIVDMGLAVYFGYKGDDLPNGKPPLRFVVPAAGLAGACVGFILCPTELVKVTLGCTHTLLYSTRVFFPPQH
jgi:hypothetical protein